MPQPRPMKLPPPNPFGEPLPNSASGSVAEVHSALVLTTESGDPRYAEEMVIALDHLGLRAWRRAAMALIEYCLSWGNWPPGEAGARAYEAEHGAADPQMPCLTLINGAMLAYFRGGRNGAKSVLAHAPLDTLRGAVRLLFVTAAGTGGAMTGQQIARLLETVGAGIR